MMKIKGWQSVFKFNFIQAVKAKSFKISTIVVCLILAIGFACLHIIPALVMSDDTSSIFGEESSSDIASVQPGTLYLFNETAISPDLSGLPSRWTVQNIEESEVEAITEKISTAAASETETAVAADNLIAVLLVVQGDAENGFAINLFRPQNEEFVTSSECYEIVDLVQESFVQAKFLAAGVSQNDMDLARSSIYTNVVVAGDEVEDPFVQALSSILPILSSCFIFMLIISYGQMISQSVAQEKSSRVIEILLTSVKPLAVIVGKILSMGCVVLFQVAIIGIVVGAVNMICMPFSFITKMASGAIAYSEDADIAISFLNETVASMFNPLNITLILIIFILGFLFYALIFGLVGASVSRIEDLAAAQQPVAFISVIGFFLAYFPAIFGMDSGTELPPIVTILGRYLPISSPFALPSAILLGEMSVAESLISVAFLAVCVVIFAVFVAKVYEHIILYSGNQLKMKDMLKIAKTSK